MEQQISVYELVKREQIRNDMPFEFLNKMTDDEILQYEKSVEDELPSGEILGDPREVKKSIFYKAMERDLYYITEKDEIRRYEEDNLILDEVRKSVSDELYEIILEEIKESENPYNYSIVSEPVGERQDSEEEEHLGSVYVDQLCGYSGDDYSGEVSIKIGDKKYLRFSFYM